MFFLFVLVLNFVIWTFAALVYPRFAAWAIAVFSVFVLGVFLVRSLEIGAAYPILLMTLLSGVAVKLGRYLGRKYLAQRAA
jgi:hypothetical protein